MRALTAMVIAVATLLSAGALSVVEPAGLHYGGWGWALGQVTLWVGFGCVVLGIAGLLAYGVHALATRGSAREWRTRLALGETRAALVRAEARRGARHGVLAAGSAAGLGAAYASIVTAQANAGEPLAVAWVSVATLAVLVTLAIALTAGIFALVAAQSTAVRVREPRGGASTFWRVLTVLVAVSAVAVAWDRVAGIGVADGDAGSWWAEMLATALGAARGVLWTGGLLLAVRWCTRAVAWIAQRAGLRLTRLGDRDAGALIASSTGLTHRSRARSVATGTVLVTLMVLTFAAVDQSVDGARAEVATTFVPRLMVVAPDAAPRIAAAGYSPGGLPSEALDALTADARVIAVPASVLRDEAFEWDLISPTGEATAQSAQFQTLLVDPADLEAVAADGLRPLGLQDGTVTPDESEDYGASHVSTRVEVFGPQGAGLTGFVLPFTARPYVGLPSAYGTQAWASSVLGEAPVSAVVLWPAEGATSTEAREAAAEVAVRFGLEVVDERDQMESGGVIELGGFETNSGFLTVVLLAGVGLLVQLSIVTARDRRGELATLAALGASPAGLRWAPAVEVAVTMACAALIALPVGGALALVTGHPTLTHPGAPLDLGETMWGLGWAFTHASWTVPAVTAVVAFALGAIAAGIVGQTMARRTPVEELREAAKEGVL